MHPTIKRKMELRLQRQAEQKRRWNAIEARLTAEIEAYRKFQENDNDR